MATAGWPTLVASVDRLTRSQRRMPQTNPQYKINAESIQRAASKLEYSGTLDAMAGLLGIKIGQGTPGFDVFFTLPVVGKITYFLGMAL